MNSCPQCGSPYGCECRLSFKQVGPTTIQINNQLSRRDAFAAAAMQGIFTKFFATNETYDIFAKHAVELADALIQELDKEKG